jgi:hypothetical protein
MAVKSRVGRGRRPGFSPRVRSAELQREGPKLLPAVIGYVTAIVIALPFPRAAIASYLGLAVNLVVPFPRRRTAAIPTPMTSEH